MEIKIETESKEELVENEVLKFEDVNHFVSIKDELPSQSFTCDNKSWNKENDKIEVEDNYSAYDLHCLHETKTCVNLNNLSHSIDINEGVQVNKRNPKIESNGRKQESENKQAYSYKEKIVLTSIIDKYKNIIENKKTNAEDNKRKKEAWLIIEANYNSQPEVDCKRTAHQLKRCWENLKQRQRKNYTTERNSYLATIGGPPLKIAKPDVRPDKLVISAAPFSDFEIDSPIGNAAVYRKKDILSTSTEKHDEGAKLTCEASPKSGSFSHYEIYLDIEKTLRIQKLKESIEHQKVLQNLKVEAATAERNAKRYEEEYWKKKLENL